MLYTQTSLSLDYNLERVSESLQCYSATYQFGIVAWLRLEPNSYSTKLYSLHRRCSFGPVAVALGQLSESFVLSAAFLLLGVVCVALDLLLGVGGRQMSLSLRAGRAALAEDMGMTLLPRAHQIMALCCWRCALWCEMVLMTAVGFGTLLLLYGPQCSKETLSMLSSLYRCRGQMDNSFWYFIVPYGLFHGDV